MAEQQQQQQEQLHVVTISHATSYRTHTLIDTHKRNIALARQTSFNFLAINVDDRIQ